MSADVVMDPAAPIIDRARHLTEDLRLASVRAWKDAHPGGLALGYLPVYVPRPLFEAMGILPVGIFGGGDQVDIIRGDSYFQSYICHLPRSVIELALSEAYAALDGMVFPSTCDVIRNLSGMWKLLFPDKYAAYLDLPQNLEPSLGGKFMAQDLRRIAHELAARGARPLTDDALWAAIAVENERRALLGELDRIRHDAPWRLRASEAYVIARAGTLLPAAQHIAMLNAVLDAVKSRQGRAYDNVRVVVTGAFCEQPPLGLLKTLEKAGCDIVDDDLQLGLKYVEGAIPTGGGLGPIDALAQAYVVKGTPTACRYIGGAKKGDSLVSRVKASHADGVIFAAASFCDPALLDQPMLEKTLDQAKIPHTSFKFAENSGQYQTIREQAGAFSDAVKLWGGTR